MEHVLCFYPDVIFFAPMCNKEGMRSKGTFDCMHYLLFKSGGCFQKGVQ